MIQKWNERKNHEHERKKGKKGQKKLEFFYQEYGNKGEKKLLKFSKDKEEILMFLWGGILQDANMENLQVYLTFIKT